MHSSYIGRQATLPAMVYFHLLVYTPMEWIPLVSIASTTDGYSHSPPATRFSIVPVIFHDAQWWNPSSTLSISPITNHLSLLYISPRVCTIYPVLSSTLATIPHRLRDFHRYW